MRPAYNQCADDFIKFWRQSIPKRPPFAHPSDFDALHVKNSRYIHSESISTFDDFVASARFGDFKDARLDLSLLPVPYQGDLREADIFVLLLNPGFGYTDYYSEWEVPEFRKRREQNLVQDFEGIEFPFLGLDPDFCWHGAFRYWEEKFRSVLRRIAEVKERSYLDVLREMSKRLVALQLVPYHSPRFRSGPLINKLASTQQARKFADECPFSQNAEWGKAGYHYPAQEGLERSKE